MKNKLLKFLALAFTCLSLSAVATACGGGNNSSSSSPDSSVEDSSSSGVEDGAVTDDSLTFKTLSVNGNTAYGKFSNATEEFSFADEIQTSDNNSFVVSKDKYGSQTYVTKIVPLQEGDNVFYVFTMDGGNVVDTYTVILRRRLIYNVAFNTQGGTEVSTQEVEEDGFATIPDQPTRTGYTFKDWTFDFTKPISQNLTITATWTVNKYTLTVVYGNGQPDKEITQSYGSTLSLGTPKRDGYFFEGWNKTTMPAEDTTVTARWQPIFILVGGMITGLTEAGKTLSEIEIPSQIDGVNITSIGDGAFYGCDSLTSIEIPNSVTSIGEEAFLGCDGLTSIEIPNGVTSIGEYAFYSCSSLTSIEIPDGVTSIGNWAFEYCEGLTSIEIPNSVTSIGSQAFAGCSSLTSIKVSNLNTAYKSVAGNLYSKDGKTLVQYAIGKTATSFIIPNSVTDIGNYAFYRCSSLTSIEIPNSVTSIGEYAFNRCDNLEYNEKNDLNYLGNSTNPYLYLAGTTSTSITSANIDDNCRFIGGSAFRYCESLTIIEIPNSVTSIGGWAFSGCDGLTGIEIPNSVTSIGEYAFNRCSSLTGIEIPDSVTSIGEGAFNSCSSLTSIEIPNSVTNIGYGAFRYCESLTSIEIPDSVTSIGNGAFSGCSSLTEVHYTGTIDDWAQISFGDESANPLYRADNFYINNELVTEVKLTTATKISAYAFYGFDSLTSIEMPNSVTSIGNYAFYRCSSLTSIEILNSVTSIGESAFDGCSNLTEVHYTGTINDWAQISFGDESANPLYYADNFYINNELVTEVKLTTATKISAYAFYGCDSLTSIKIPDSVTSIGSQAFDGCRSLTSVVIGNGVTSIGEYAFEDCFKLVEVVNKSTHITVIKGDIENGYVGYYALTVYNSTDTFTGTKLSNDNGYIVYTDGAEKILLGYTGKETDLTLPTYITQIYNYAFYDCRSLTSVEIPNSVTSIGNSAFYDCRSLTSVEIPNSVTSIGNSAFYGCSSLTSIEIPNGVTSIGNLAFRHCYNLQYTTKDNLKYLGNTTNPYLYLAGTTSTSITSATIADNCRFIGEAFFNCSSLTSVKIPNSVTSIGSQAFDGCRSLTSVVIPNSVTSIGDWAFEYCSNLTSVVIPDGVTSIGNFAFYSCTNLTSIEIPNSVTSIGEGAFEYCRSLTSVVIPDGVTSIGGWAFYGCNSLTSVEIPNSVTSIGNFAFCLCSNLTSVVLGDNVTSIGNGAFANCSSLTSIVVSNSNTAYKSIDGNLYSKDGKTLVQYAIGKTATSFIVSDDVTSIGYGAFFNCSHLTSVVIPDSVTSIGRLAFDDCDNLTIYCEAGSQPSGWDSEWMDVDCTVVWGYTGEN